MTATARPSLDDLGLAPRDRVLLEASAIAPEVAVARGYTTVYTRAALEKLGFGPSQRNVPALVIPIYDAFTNGRPLLHQARPHEPRREPRTGKVIKYETPRGASMMVDVPRPIRSRLGDPKIPLFITEGVRKADAAVSVGLCCVALLGVWNWRGRNDDGGLTALPDWEAIAFNDRDVSIVFDSDVMTKATVYVALVRLKAFLERKGATVKAIYLPSGPGGTKCGLDDFLASGKTVDDLLGLATTTLREPPPGAAASGTTGGGRPSQADQLVQLALEAGPDLFHDLDGESYATVPAVGHRETWKLTSKGFRAWMHHRLFEADGKAANGEATRAALGVLDGKARFDGPMHRVWIRVAEHEGGLYLDLADADWRAVEITPDGWRVVTNVPVKFRRTRGMLPLPLPARGGTLGDLGRFINVASDTDARLLVAWLLAALRPNRPFCVLCLHGEQGSAKTTTARMLRALVDPNVAAVRSAPKDTRDLVIAAKNAWIPAFDNLSHIPTVLSDDLCRLATGGGFGTRELYTDDEEVLFDAQRPIIVTGIEDLATRGDLLDRALLVELPSITPADRRPEAALWREFDAARPALLGALLDAAVMGLRHLPTTTVTPLPRMADFALWIEAAAPALGWAPGSFTALYTANRASANDLVLDASPVGTAIVTLMHNRTVLWEGSASDLLVDLGGLVDDRVKGLPSWPKTPRGLAGILKRLAPNLRASGITLADLPRHGAGRRLRLTNRPPSEEGAPPSPPTPDAVRGRPVVASRSDGVCDARPLGSHQPPEPSPDRRRASAWNGSRSVGSDGGDGSLAVSTAAEPAGGPPRERTRL